MPITEIKRDAKLIKVLASQAAGRSVDPKNAEEAEKIIRELANENSENSIRLIAQTIGFTIQELQSRELDFLNQIADMKNVGYGERAMFRTRWGGIKAYIQAKGSTTARSYLTDKQVEVVTEEISARPAMNILDYQNGRIPFADIIRDANREITTKKLEKIEAVFHDAVDDFGTPFYATGTGIVKATIDSQIAYFARLGPVTLLGDRAAVTQLTGLTGMAMNPGASEVFNQFAPEYILEHNMNGFIGRYNGCNVIAMQNGYRDDSTTPILDPNWIYIIPGGMSGDARNLKVVNEGPVQTMSSQNIDDKTMEIRIDQYFGAGVVTGKKPTIGAYKIGT